MPSQPDPGPATGPLARLLPVLALVAGCRGGGSVLEPKSTETRKLSVSGVTRQHSRSTRS